MRAMKRRLSTPAILLLSLSMGIWLGASWHAASQAKSGGTCCASCIDGARLLSSIQHRASSAIVCHEKIAHPDSSCPFCAVGAMFQNLPLAISTAVPAIKNIPERSTPHPIFVHTASTNLLPPGRAPPVVA